MAAYYNENDPYAAQWLRNLIGAGHIAPGNVDERSIADVQPDDLRGYTQCHFFAGIGGWSYALRLALWPDDGPVWTGSCPCQPFSQAGRRKGIEDERHLWPVWRELIAECGPSVVFGEQVASRDGRDWLASVRAEMEALGYAVGAADLCAAGVGAPHIRQRLWFVAHADDAGSQGRVGVPERADQCTAGSGSVAVGLADTNGQRRNGVDTLLRAEATGRLEAELRQAARRSEENWLANAGCVGREMAVQQRCNGREAAGERAADVNGSRSASGHWPSTSDGFWRDADWLSCRDGKWRCAEPRTFPLAHGAPSRVGRLRAYGNAIVPQVAAQFIQATMNTEGQ